MPRPRSAFIAEHVTDLALLTHTHTDDPDALVVAVPARHGLPHGTYRLDRGGADAWEVDAWTSTGWAYVTIVAAEDDDGHGLSANAAAARVHVMLHGAPEAPERAPAGYVRA